MPLNACNSENKGISTWKPESGGKKTLSIIDSSLCQLSQFTSLYFKVQYFLFL